MILRRRRFPLVPIFFALAIVSVHAGETPIGPGSLTLTLRPARASYVMYEPVLLRLEVRNPTQSSITTTDLANIGLSNISFQISGPDGGRLEYHVRDPIGCGVSVGRTYPPESVLVRRAVIDWQGERYAFYGAGSYTIVAQNGTIKSAPIRIEIDEPRGADARMLDALSTRDEMLRLLRVGPSGYCAEKSVGECGDRIAALCRKHHASHYAPALMVDVARAAAYYGDKRTGDGLRKGVALLEEVLSRWPADSASAEAMAALAPLLVPLGRYPEAVKLVERLRSDFPEDPELAEHADIAVRQAAGLH